MEKTNMMEYILGRLITHNIKYEKVTNKSLRVYGNFNGFSSVREANDGWVEVDGKLMDYEDFENWLYDI